MIKTASSMLSKREREWKGGREGRGGEGEREREREREREKETERDGQQTISPSCLLS